MDLSNARLSNAAVSPEPQDNNLGSLDPSQVRSSSINQGERKNQDLNFIVQINNLNTETARSKEEGQQQASKMWKARVTVKG